MSYTGSKAQSGAGTNLNINTGTVTTPVWTPVGEITNMVQSGKQNATDDTTNLQSTAEEFIATFLRPGKFDVSLNRVPGDTGQAAFKASFDAKTILMYQIVLPKTIAQITTGDMYAFTALVEEMADLTDVQPTKKITCKAILKVSGPVTLTVGS